MDGPREGTYVTVQPFMVRDLGLSGNELLVYAVIYGFSQDGESWYTGSRGYLAEWCNTTPKSVTSNLQKLLDKGLIERRRGTGRSARFSDYRAVLEKVEVRRTSHMGKKLPREREETSLYEGEETSPHNIDIYRDSDNKENHKANFPDAIIDGFTDDASLRRALREFVDLRKRSKRPLTEYALKLNLKKLKELGGRPPQMLAIVEQTVMNGWQGFYPLKQAGEVAWDEDLRDLVGRFDA